MVGGTWNVVNVEETLTHRSSKKPRPESCRPVNGGKDKASEIAG